MKILWLSHVFLTQDRNGKFLYPGGNWILSLKHVIKNEKEIELAIVSFGDENIEFIDDFGTKYYQIEKINKSKFERILYRWQHKIEEKREILKLLKVIENFKPDLIHIFGTESEFAQVIEYVKIPVVIHLQGIINPYINAWYFSRLSKYKIIKNSNIFLLAKGVGFFHDYFRFKKMAERELIYFKNCKYFMGRTDWDKSITKLFAPNAKYFHCDEVIRDKFYHHKWSYNKSHKIKISSTINWNIYKGLDLILKTANLLKKWSNIEFEWNIYGIQKDSEYVKMVEDVVKYKFKDNNVILEGVVLEDELVKNLLESTLFIHSSYIDNSPNSICEAQLIGLPVISTNVGGISTLIKNELDGFLIPSNEPHILAAKIINLLNDVKTLDRISKNGIDSAQKRHNRSKIKSDLIKIYRNIISNSNLEIK